MSKSLFFSSFGQPSVIICVFQCYTIVLIILVTDAKFLFKCNSIDVYCNFRVCV
jgi:hypothetical protein